MSYLIPPPFPLSLDATSVSSPTMYAPISQSTNAPIVKSGHPDTPNIPAQPSLWPAYPDCLVLEFEEQVEVLKSGSQAYKGGNVMVEDSTPSFSPYFLPSFSLDDFVAHSLPDIAMDLDSFTYSMASYPYMVVHSVSFYDMDSLAPPSLLLFTVGPCSPLPL